MNTSGKSLQKFGPLTNRLLREIEAEFPNFRLAEKEGNRLSSVLHVLLMVITLGGQHSYLYSYHTVLGDTLYLAKSWHSMSDISRVILLRHERVHLRQKQRYGMIGFSLLYLVPFFPIGLAYFRARLEWEAYVETLVARHEYFGRDALIDELNKRELLRRFTGPDYGFMWPFPGVVGRWYDRAIEEILAPAVPG